MNHAHLYCKTLADVSREELICALHQANTQLRAAHAEQAQEPFPHLDHAPSIAENERLLRKAGHIGFTP